MGADQLILFSPETLEVRMIALAQFFITCFCCAYLIERGFSAIFNHRLYKEKLSGKGLKLPLVFLASLYAAHMGDLDAMVFLTGTGTGWFGEALTALLLSGGSKKVAEMWGDLKAGVQRMEQK